MRPARRAAAALVAVLLALTALATAHAAPANPADWRCQGVSLARPLTTNPDRNPDGTPVRISPDSRGKYVPVIMVHGWVSEDTQDGTNRDGAFSHLIDLTANRLGTAEVPRSLIGQLQRIPGAAVFTFDYRDYAARWVDDPHLGPALGAAIDCLFAASGEKVIVVGHSMGGLVARYAATHPGTTGADRAGEISTVITFGTPETGSVAALLTDAALNGPADELTVLHLILAQCGQLAGNSVRTGSLCDRLPPPVRAFDSPAGRALRAGSPQLAALRPFPRGIAVDALAGDATFRVPKLGWFGLSWDTSDVPVGDLVVTAGSALAGAAQTRKVDCSYQLDAIRGAADQVGLWFGLVAKNDAAQQPLAAFGGPCFHSDLMRGIELTNEATGAVNDDIAARQPTTAIVPLRPTDAHGRLSSGYAVAKTVTGQPDSVGGNGCQAGSEVVDGAYRCFGTDNGVYDPCWPDTGAPGTWAVACLTTPWSTGVTRIVLASPPPPAPTTGPLTSGNPWAVQLATGQRCVEAQGAHDSYQGQVVSYGCDGDLVLIGYPNRATRRWTTLTAHYANGYTGGPPAQITTAWFGLPVPP